MTECIHPKIKRYRIKGTGKIRWICECCGYSGISIPKQKKIVPQVLQMQNQPIQQYPTISGNGIGYKNMTENLQEGMKDLNSGIRTMPHVVIGKDKKQQLKQIQQPILSDKEQKIVSKLRKWAFIIAITAVIGYAGYRILGVIFNK